MPTQKSRKARQPKSDAAADPDKLVRQTAGSYRTADERFEVREAGIGWYLVDTSQHDELGQELLQGPYSTLKEVRAAIPAARSEKVTPIRPPKKGRSGAARKKGTARAEKPAPPPPPTWIEKLPAREATEVRRLIGALEKEGLGDVEALVRRDREGLGPAVAEELIARRISELVDALPEDERAAGRRLADELTELLTRGGTRDRGGLPGWILVELRPDDSQPPNRKITL